MRFFSVLAIAAISLSAVAQQQPTVTIQKSSELVTIPVLVTDKAGKPVHGLARQDFTVKEDGKIDRPIAVFEELQAVQGPVPRVSKTETVFSNFGNSDSRVHRLTIIVLDMLNTPFADQARARSELIKFLSSNLHGDDPIALLVIGRNGLTQIHALTANPEVLIQALKRVTGHYSTADSVAADEAAQAHLGDLSPNSTSNSDSSDVSDETDQLNQFLKDSESIATAFQERQAIRTTLAALEQIAQAFGGLPGRKTLVWASSGFPFMVEDPQSIVGFGTDTVADYERTFRAMNSANIAVYPIDATGLFNPAYAQFEPARPVNPRFNRMPGRRPTYDRYQQMQDTLRAFASATGGNTCLNRNDLSKCFREAEQDSDSYYMLAYYLPSGDRKPGWHKLKVAVDRKGTHVRARTGFLVTNPQVIRQDDTRKTEILTALGSPVDYTGLPFTIGWSGVKPDEEHPGHVLARFELDLHADAFTVDVDQQNHLELDFAALAFTDKQKEAGEFTRIVEAHLQPDTLAAIRRGGIKFNANISLPKGKFNVRFVVRDDLGGKIGTVTAPLEVK